MKYILDYGRPLNEADVSDSFEPIHYKSMDGWFNYADYYKELSEILQNGQHFVEVGTWQGKSVAYLGELLKNKGKKVKIDAIDLFDGPEKTHHTDEIKSRGGLLKIFKENMKTAGIDEMINPIQCDSVKSAENYKDESLDVVFIDAMHTYEGCKGDIAAYFPKVKKGGIISGHDYADAHPGVIKAVDEFFKEKKLKVQRKSKTVWFVTKK